MPLPLATALRETLSDWQDDLPDSWRDVLADVRLGFGDCDSTLELEPWEPIFPARRKRVFPGAPKGAHMLRAFDGLDPSAVRCLVLGQDPYPEPGFATGRAFEAGNIAEWRELDKMFSKSVRAYLQLVCAARTGNGDYARSFDDWPELLGDIEAGRVELEQPDALADRWVGQGVLLLNASLTLSRFAVETDPHQSHGHLPVWRPLMLRILGHIVESGRHCVILAFGDPAADCLTSAGLDSPPSHIHIIRRPHPAFAEDLLALENPFVACNSLLQRADKPPISW